MFKLDKIKIYPDCWFKKNLEAATYYFGGSELDNFYGDGISLQVIVGKNGSGKSSIIDMILRMANNVGALLFKDANRHASADLNYILGIHADLYYKFIGKDGITYNLCLCCRDTAMWLESNNVIYWLSDKAILGCHPDSHTYYEECENRGDGREIKKYNNLSPDNQQEIANLFFYTVATNYSMLGFLSPDYDEEYSLRYVFDLQGRKDMGDPCDENPHPLGKYRWEKTRNWINSLFHKNDGYMSPIVLNPYRNDAKLDMENETNLTVQRLSAMFICEKEDMPLVPGYKLDGISYEYKDSFLRNFQLYKDGWNKREIIGEFLKCAQNDESYAKMILDCLGCSITENQHEYLVVLAMYMVQKILNIAATYPLYIERFGGIGGIDRTFMMIEKDDPHIVIPELVDYVVSHHSHIELKFHQALEFYNWATQNMEDFYNLLENFNYKEYKESRHLPEYGYHQLGECMMTLPPAIFKQHIYLQKKREDGFWLSEIPIWRMSSGERQLIYQLSTIVYHLHNLASVYRPNLKYLNVNIILDEIEICYHPDYQRRFVKALIDMLKTHNFNRLFNLHVLITTHSPFVLSDVVASHIMYLKGGHQLRGEELSAIQNPFAANVNEILKQSFFMDDGFVGSFAADKINSLVNYLKGEPGAREWSENEIESLIANIGDSLVVFQLKKLIAKYKEKNGLSYRDWLESELLKFR